MNIKAALAQVASDDVDSAASARGDSNDSAVIRPDPVTNVKSITYVFKVRPCALAAVQSSLNKFHLLGTCSNIFIRQLNFMFYICRSGSVANIVIVI